MFNVNFASVIVTHLYYDVMYTFHVLYARLMSSVSSIRILVIVFTVSKCIQVKTRRSYLSSLCTMSLLHACNNKVLHHGVCYVLNLASVIVSHVYC